MSIHRSARKNFHVMWHHGSLQHKILFYLHPFLQDLVYIWSDVWSVNLLAAPLPAVVKLSLSVLILCVMLLPLVYCVVGTAMYLGFLQYQIESLYPGIISKQFKVYHWFGDIFQQLNFSEETVQEWKRQFYQGLLFVVGTTGMLRLSSANNVTEA